MMYKSVIFIVILGILFSNGYLDGVLVFLNTFPLIYKSYVFSRDEETRLRPQYEHLRSTVPLRAQNCFVTGTSSGLGYAIAVELMNLGCNVTGVQRRSSEELNERIKAESSNGEYNSVACDFSDLTLTRSVTQRLTTETDYSVVVFNAAVFATNSRTTAQGTDFGITVNVLAPFVQASVFAELPTPPEKVMWISSDSHQAGRSHNTTADAFVDWCMNAEYAIGGSMSHYSDTKFSAAAVALSFQSKFKRAGAFDPGPTVSDIGREAPAFLQPAVNLLMRLVFYSARSRAEAFAHFLVEAEVSFYRIGWAASTLNPRVSGSATYVAEGCSRIMNKVYG